MARGNKEQNSILMSIVVPVYNKENTLTICVDSIREQTVDKSKIEVILVNDGSVDESLALCEQLAEELFYVRVLSQENQGVSAARNTGINAAQGKYIMFLDADDSLTRPSVKNLIRFFEEVHDEVDVVSYPLVYFNLHAGSRRGHKRRKWLTEEGVYDLIEYPFIAQTTMNVCVKNKGADNVLFNSSVKMGEDQLFVTENLKEKAKIGFCDQAEYIYVKDGSNSSRIGNNPLYAFDDMMFLYHTFLETAEEQPLMASYAYQTLLYNIDWRLRSNLLFPTHCSGEEKESLEKRLAQVFKSIPAGEYCESPYLSEYHKAYLLHRYGLLDEPITIEYEEENTIVGLGDGNSWETRIPNVVINYCMRKEGRFFFQGRLICPTFLFENEPELFLEDPAGKNRVSLKPSSYDYSGTKFKSTKSYGFAFSVPDQDIQKENTLRFVLDIPGRSNTPVNLSYNLRRHNARFFKGILLFKDREMRIEEDAFVLKKKSIFTSLSSFTTGWQRDSAYVAKRFAVSSFMRRHKNERVWIYSDLPTSPVKGNAFVQIMHDLKKDDGIERYYVSNFGEELVAEHPTLAGHVLECESREHVYYALKAEVVFASYLENFTFRPVSNKTFHQLADLTVPQKYVYLQHGILHAHMPWYFSYDRILFDYEVISTQFELDNLTGNYHFPKGALIPSGMPRFDEMRNRAEASQKSKKILYAPSWRGYLVAGKASKRVGIDEMFLSSSFYLGMKSFLEAIKTSGVLERFGYTLEVKLHPNFACYEHLLSFDSDLISLAPPNINEDEYPIVISDFSSYIYDFVYAGSSVLYFVPDIVEFHAGMNQYSDLDMPLDSGFGPYSTDADEAATLLEGLIEVHEGNKEEDARVAALREGFFLHEDGLCSARLYEHVSSLQEEDRLDFQALD